MILKPKYNDEVIELDLENPETVDQVTSLVQKGMYYDKKGKTELESLSAKVKEYEPYKGYVDNYNQTLKAAKTDDSVAKEFVAKLESELGRKLSFAEERDAQQSIFADDKDEVINELRNELKQIKRDIEGTKVDLLGRDINTIHTELSRRYSGADGLPRYDADTIQKYIDDKGLFSNDLQGLYEDSYHTLNRDKIYEDFKSKRFAGDRNNVRIQNGDPANLSLKEPIQTKGKGYNDVKRQILERLQKEGGRLVTSSE